MGSDGHASCQAENKELAEVGLRGCRQPAVGETCWSCLQIDDKPAGDQE